MRSDQSLFTVVIPTLNARPDSLSQCLASVTSQSLLPKEILIVNNGPRGLHIDGDFSRVQTIETVMHAGVAQARNVGATLASTPYVAFLDDDDLWASDYLELMARHIREQSPDCLVARLDQLVEDIVLPYKNAHGLLQKSTIFVRNPGITGSSVVVKRDAFLSAGGYNTQLPPSEDKALILELLRGNSRIITVPDCQAIIRQHKGERLTRASNLATGISAFLRTYGHEMTLRQRLYNRWKVARLQIESKIAR